MRAVRYFGGEVAVIMSGNIGKDYFTITLSGFPFLRVIGDRIHAFDMQIATFIRGSQLDPALFYRQAITSADSVV